MACATEEIHLNDIGTVFELTVNECNNTTGINEVVDISSASSIVLYFLKPDKSTTLTKTATFSTDGTDGKIRYLSETGDLDATGTWKIQGQVQLPTGTWSTDIHSFKVWPNLF